MKKPEMTAQREGEILEAAIHKYGAGAQIIKACEEFSELTCALTRFLNGQDSRENVIEEMADAFIMLNQLELIFDDCTGIEIAKLERLEQRIKEAV